MAKGRLYKPRAFALGSISSQEICYGKLTAYIIKKVFCVYLIAILPYCKDK